VLCIGTIVKPEDVDAAAAWIIKDEKALALILAFQKRK